MARLIVACVEQGNYQGRGAEYVHALSEAVWQKLGRMHQFVCFSDSVFGLHNNILRRQLPSGVSGWWSKLALFQPGLFEPGSRILFFDLDTIILDALEPFADWDGEFGILRDFYRPDGYGSGIMSWRAGFGTEIWNSWEEAGRPQIDGGDQAWIERAIKGATRLQDVLPGFFRSYKAECLPHQAPVGAHVVCFHGVPKPHQLAEGWARKAWLA